MRTTASIRRTLVTTALVVVTGAGLALLARCALAQGCCGETASAAATSSAPATTAGDAVPTNPQTTCPVMGGKINKNIFADYQGKRVYFCCKGCPAEFAKDPAKYVKKLEAAGITLAKTPVQTTCPVMGGKINKAIFVDYQGKRVYFCCGGCPAEFNKDPAKYVKALEAKGVVLDKTPQTQPAAPGSGA